MKHLIIIMIAMLSLALKPSTPCEGNVFVIEYGTEDFTRTACCDKYEAQHGSYLNYLLYIDGKFKEVLMIPYGWFVSIRRVGK